MISNFSCYFCEGANGKHLHPAVDFYAEEYAAVKCENCSTINLHPRPTQVQLEQAYNRDYYGAGEAKFNPHIERMLNRAKKRRATAIAKFTGKQGKVLDIGCADGSFLSQFTSIGDFELEGIELDQHAAVRAAQNSNIQLHIGKLKDMNLEASSYSAISLNHVFEHLEDPKFTLDKASELISPKGVLLIAIPNINSYQARWFKNNWFHLDPPRHLFFMTRNHLKQEMKQRGFELVYERHHHIEYNPYGFQQSLLNAISPHRELLYEFLKGNSHLVETSKFQMLLHRLFVMMTLPFFFLVSLLAAMAKRSGTMELLFQKK